jgi:hydroxyacylglutathione hydrolase
MRLRAKDVYQLSGFPPHAINIYVVGGMLVDAGTPGAARRILRQVRSRRLRAHVVTHAHPDHFGASHAVCRALDLPLWTGEGDAHAVETGTPVLGDGRIQSILTRLPRPAAHPVSRELHEGDEIEGFTVLEVPGHSPGHIALWRASDRTLLAGDVFWNVLRLGPPPAVLSFDPQVNRDSMRRLIQLEPRLTLLGHGPPVRDVGELARAAL